MIKISNIYKQNTDYKLYEYNVKSLRYSICRNATSRLVVVLLILEAKLFAFLLVWDITVV